MDIKGIVEELKFGREHNLRQSISVRPHNIVIHHNSFIELYFVGNHLSAFKELLKVKEVRECFIDVNDK